MIEAGNMEDDMERLRNLTGSLKWLLKIWKSKRKCLKKLKNIENQEASSVQIHLVFLLKQWQKVVLRISERTFLELTSLIHHDT